MNDWPGIKVEIFATSVEVNGETKACLRLRAPDQAELPTRRLIKPSEPHVKGHDNMDDEIPFLPARVHTVLATALTLARRGLRVFPCLVQGKQPACERGCLAATVDESTIRQRWQSEPCYNIGVACGSLSGIFVVDVDSHEAEARLAKLEAEHGKLPPTVEVITIRGRHLYFVIRPSTRCATPRQGLHPALIAEAKAVTCWRRRAFIHPVALMLGPSIVPTHSQLRRSGCWRGSTAALMASLWRLAYGVVRAGARRR